MTAANDSASATPIIVHATPTQPQLEAALRVAIVALGSIAGALGYAGLAPKLAWLTQGVGPLAAVIAFVWGQVATREHAKKLATLANALPDAVAKAE